MLGGGILDPTGTQLATKGANSGGSYKLSTLKSNRSHKDDGGLQLVARRHGETITRATQAGAEDKISVASDSSQRAIMVRQTFKIEHDRNPNAPNFDFE